MSGTFLSKMRNNSFHYGGNASGSVFQIPAESITCSEFNF
jgi:hypothetical protein